MVGLHPGQLGVAVPEKPVKLKQPQLFFSPSTLAGKSRASGREVVGGGNLNRNINIYQCCGYSFFFFFLVRLLYILTYPRFLFWRKKESYCFVF